MRVKLVLLICFMTSVGCAHRPCQTLGALFGCQLIPRAAPPEVQDMSLQLPMFDHTLRADASLDGYTLQAIRIAADDFLDVDSTGLACEDKQVSHQYHAVRREAVIFVRIEFKPENCGRTVGMLDAGATYAISVDGRILRREMDGSGPF